MKYYIIAGEASGDLHASNLVKHLNIQDPDASFRGWGGDLMENEGLDLVKHYRDLAFMGFLEVLQNLRTIWNNLRFCKKDISQFKPDVLILVDYPGFNLRIADWASAQGLRVFYYISPQVWAWNAGRVPKMRSIIDEMFVILPFEKEFFAKYDFPVHYVGHPLLDVIPQFKSGSEKNVSRTINSNPVIALLPGSRKQEISRILPVMMSVASNFKDCRFILAGAPHIPESFYRQFISGLNLEFISAKAYEVLSQADAALVTSGTATLETALFKVPQVICYKGNPVSFAIAKRLVDVPFIGLVNLVAGEQIVKELIQDDLNPENLASELSNILIPENREKIFKGYEKVEKKLGSGGASEAAAKLMYNFLK